MLRAMNVLVGGIVTIEDVGSISATVKIDDRNHLIGNLPTAFNLSVGLHSFVVEQTFEADKETHQRPPAKILCHGTIDVRPELFVKVMVSEAGCSGLGN